MSTWLDASMNTSCRALHTWSAIPCSSATSLLNATASWMDGCVVVVVVLFVVVVSFVVVVV